MPDVLCSSPGERRLPIARPAIKAPNSLGKLPLQADRSEGDCAAVALTCGLLRSLAR